MTQKLTRDEIRTEGVIRFDLSINTRFQYPRDVDKTRFKRWLELSGITRKSGRENIPANRNP